MSTSNVGGFRLAGTLGVLLALLMTGCAPSPEASQGTTSPSSAASPATATVRVAAAADLKFAMEQIKTDLAASHPDIELVTTYGSSGTFYQQLSDGAPFDLFLSADLGYPRKLAEAGLADPDDVFGYAVGRLVVWAANESPVDPTTGMASLSDPAALKIAIANPEHAPYGVAAVAAMKTAGVYDSASGRLVLGENVAQAAEFVLSGNAQVGVIALSLAVSPQFEDWDATPRSRWTPTRASTRAASYWPTPRTPPPPTQSRTTCSATTAWRC